MKVKIDEILSSVKEKYSVMGKLNGEKYITGTKPILEAGDEDIVWVSPSAKNPAALIKETKAKVVVCSNDLSLPDEILKDRIFLCVQDPKLTFSRIVNKFFVEKDKFGIDKTALISPDARIDEEVFIGPNCIIGNCEIKRGSILQGNVYVYDNVSIGENVKIYAGTVIGSDGFGFYKNEQGEYEKFPHVGGVVIENNVEIGANTVIDKGSLGNTVIGEGSKIDNLVHIAHNVKIGKNVMVIASAEVSGSVEIGDNSWIAPGAVILDRITIGKNAVIGLGAVVIRNVEDGATVVGNPAKRIK